MTIDPAFTALIHSDRVSARTRDVLLARTQPDDRGKPSAIFTAAQMTTLRAVADRIVPQMGTTSIDIGARIDAALTEGVGDGWRFAPMPADVDAYRAALDTMMLVAETSYGRPFADLDGHEQDALLRRAGEGRLAVDDGSTARFSASQMQLWFEDVRADAVKAYVSHPATLARIGYSGMANGGDGLRPQGFVNVGPDARETWEPRAKIGTRT